ncbi:hypothetical protein FSW04_14900 [Baekduia soli]|uniref:Uncharacterized protein n=1 Tax=Baekduia soli TaxID=496014 RepID=A0A5B8U725_9ACTN|nr:hypothetical protein [Baekduia soli]QEC48731.1 hypothetical protein FSW04_14900 [Baekduia soli]
MSDPVPPSTPRGHHSAARTASLLAGGLAALLAIALLAAAGLALWADGRKDHDGYLSAGTQHLTTRAAAIASGDVDLHVGGARWLLGDDHLGTVRLRVTGATGRPVFVGIAPTHDVEPWLRGRTYERLTDISGVFSLHAHTEAVQGAGRPAPAATRRFWAASASGRGRQDLVWHARQGTWSVVVANADGSPAVDVRVGAAARVPHLATVGWVALGGGVLAGLIAAGLVAVGVRRPGPATGALMPPGPGPACRAPATGGS